MQWYKTSLFDRTFDDKIHRSSHCKITARAAGKRKSVQLCMPVPGYNIHDGNDMVRFHDDEPFYLVRPSAGDGEPYIVDLITGYCTCATACLDVFVSTK